MQILIFFYVNKDAETINYLLGVLFKAGYKEQNVELLLFNLKYNARASELIYNVIP